MRARFIMKTRKAPRAAILSALTIFTAAASAQSVWPKEYEQYARPYEPPTASQEAQAQRGTNPNLRSWQPFACEAPLSNYHQARSEQEMMSCITAHEAVFRALYSLYPEGIGYSGPLKWTVTVNPRGTVTTAVASAPGTPSQTYLQAMRSNIMNIHFGPCPPCKSANLTYTVNMAR